jgi:secreted Zn-dependent insulinase-like peptidase
MVGEQLMTMRYMAGGAGVYCDVSPLPARGYTLKCQGFSDTLPRYARTVLASLRHFEPDPVRFETQAAQLRHEYEDGVNGRGGAAQLAAAHADRLLYRIAFLPSELRAAFEGVSLADLTSFADAAFADAKAEALVMGNLERSAASTLATDALEVVRATDTASVELAATEAKQVQQAVANLQGRYYLHAFAHPNADEKNCAVQLTVQLGMLGRQEAAAAILLGDMLSQPFFGSLRTKQQLGYIASGSQTEARGVYSLNFVVQSSVATPEHVSEAVHAFLTGTLADELANMTAAKFDGYVAAARARLLQKPTSLVEEGEKLWPRLVDQSYDFQRDNDLAQVLAQGKVTIDDVRAMHTRALRPVAAEGVATQEGGRMLVWVIPKTGAASSATPTESSAPAGYALASVESFTTNVSYYPPSDPYLPAPYPACSKC